MATAATQPNGTGTNDAPAPPQPKQPPVRREMASLLERVIDNRMADTFGRQMLEAEISRDLFDQDYRLARIFAMSGMFSDIKKQTEEEAIAAAMAKIRMGRSWGLNEADSMQGIYFNNGRPAVQNELIAAKMRDAGYDWDIDWHEDTVAANNKSRKICTGCTLWLKKWNEEQSQYVAVLDRHNKPVNESFTKDDADNALIWEGGKQISLSSKWNFVSWAKDMYFWRTIARLKRHHVTNVLRGAVPQAEAQDMGGEPGADSKQESSPRPQRATGVISLASIKPSADINRGHDRTAAKVAPGAAEPAETVKADTDTTTPAAKHLGAKDGYPVFDRLPDPKTVIDGQLVWVRKENGDTLHEFSESFGNQFIECDPARLAKERKPKH